MTEGNEASSVEEKNRSEPLVTLKLDRDVLERLAQRVRFRTEADVRELVADAINAYVQLGTLHSNGARFFARQGEDGELVEMHFKFAPHPDAGALS